MADADVPVAVVIDVQGVVERLLTWPLRPDFRDREVASAVAVRGEDIWVSSPAAGGVVWFPAGSTEFVVVDLPIEARILEPDTASGRLWAAGTRGGLDDDASSGGDATVTRPVEWRDEPTRIDPEQSWIVLSAHGVVHGNVEGAKAAGVDVDAVLAEHRATWPAAGLGGDDDEDDEAGEAWDQDGDEDTIAWENTPLELWALDGVAASPVDLGGGTGDLVVAGDRLVVALRRPSDPVVMVRRPGEPVIQSEPGVLAVVDGGSVTVVADLDDIWGSFFPDTDGGVWMLGFDRDGEGVVRLNPGLGAVSAVATSIESAGICGAIAEGWFIDTEALSHDESGRGLVHHPRLQQLGTSDRVVIDSVRVSPTVRIVGRTAWFHGDRPGTLVAVELPAATARTVDVDVDLRDALPVPTPPHGLDVEGYERSSLEHVRSMVGVRHVHDRLVVTGVAVEEIFPDASLVLRFTVDGHDGRYARRVPLYDELGNPMLVEDQLGQLAEDANTGAIPPTALCALDDGGTAWC